MYEERIWRFLKGKLLSDCGAAGLMGNLYAESGLNPVNLQNTHERKLGLSDKEYTQQVDFGLYADFVHDGAGYGLAQWTFWSRKQNLLAFAKSREKSIGDLETQLEFLWKELTESYASLAQMLLSASSVRAASDAVLLQFERPADQSETAKARRAAYGQKYYDQFAGKEAAAMSNSPLVSYTKLSQAGRPAAITGSGATAGSDSMWRNAIAPGAPPPAPTTTGPLPSRWRTMGEPTRDGRYLTRLIGP